uniref:TatD related DNase n=1 Tax=Tetradesmus obliquus TaxID=3088 RepID=A0A383W6X6_TETOB|eukprot:jgi/Sobl393_1/2035/SZX73407.1
MTKSKLSQGELVRNCMRKSPAPLIDIGVNLVDHAFEKDRAEVISRAREAGVAAIIVTGCTVASATAARDLCEAVTDFPLFFTAGVHPHNAKDCDESTLQQLTVLAKHERCVAIGECGLDFNRNFSPPEVQEQWFDAQVKLALQLQKPLFMHCRDAGACFAEILSQAGIGSRSSSSSSTPGVLHCFTGNGEELQQVLGLGLCVGITGWVADDRPERGGAELAALLSKIPADRLMIETDAPYLVPRSIQPSKARPNRNEPALLPHVLTAVAAALGQGEEEVAVRTTAVAKAFFRMPDSIGS